MEGNKPLPSADQPKDEKTGTASVTSIEQLQRLVRLLDTSDVSEIELRHAEEGTHLVLRKAKAGENNGQQIVAPLKPPPVQTEAPIETKHDVVAPLVGTFHVWARPKGGALVAVGDHVKVGQLVGTIESLNMLNEVETGFAGHVLEIFVQEGQPVEYGQLLMTIESAEGK